MGTLLSRFLVVLFLIISLAIAGEPRLGNNYALIIIDMQPYFVTRGGNEKKKENIAKVNQIIKKQKEMIELA
jgi:hypothetical protein